MRKTTIAIAASVLTMAGSLLTTAPASADTEGCVTRAEYRKVHRGDTKARVHRIFDTAGHRDAISSSGGYRSEIRSYHTCSRFSAVSISWEKNGPSPWRLSGKSAVWTH